MSAAGHSGRRLHRLWRAAIDLPHRHLAGCRIRLPAPHTEMTGEAVTYPSVFAAEMRLGLLAGAGGGAALSPGLAEPAQSGAREYHKALEPGDDVSRNAKRNGWPATTSSHGLPQDPAGDPFQMRENRALYEAAFG